MSEKRFYDYGGIDLIFYPIANKLTPIFFFLKFSANTITLLSGLIGVLGAICFSSNNKLIMLLGSFGYILYYLLDYIDGNIARKNKSSSLSGMFLDLFMSPIVAISTSMALYLGGIQSGINSGVNQILLNTIGIMFLISTLILYSRFAFVWLTISTKLVEERYQNKKQIKFHQNNKKHPRKGTILNKLALSLFHENFMIFCLPIMGVNGRSLKKLFSNHSCCRLWKQNEALNKHYS